MAVVSPVQEPPEAEKEGDGVELKAESTPVELQAEAQEEQTEKSATPAPPTAEPTSEPAPAAPEENRVGWKSVSLSVRPTRSQVT